MFKPLGQAIFTFFCALYPGVIANHILNFGHKFRSSLQNNLLTCHGETVILSLMYKTHLQKSQDYVLSLLKERTSIQNKYHSIAHTQTVVGAAIDIGIGEGLSPEEMEMIQIAAWFHDLGYIETSAGHEELGAMYASNFLSEENYPSEKIDKIVNCILATKVPQNPGTKMEKILCDADLSHIGRNNFFDINDKFRAELESHRRHKFTEIEWLTTTIDFVTRHRFFTDYSIKNFSEQKLKNIKLLNDQLNSIINGSNP
ncbi:MAG: hydrolase [Ignavibacteriae bacterium HGW-Ignavibacteriae-3]|nr:MAG: hydrolase [Ignavibacteriae bacterium HGW-Ignavibacteriae-3]